MRALLVTALGLTCGAALALPPTVTAAATGPAPRTRATTVQDSAQDTAQDTAPTAAVPGSTQSLPLRPLSADRSADPRDQDLGLPARDVRRFALLGVAWDDPEAEPPGRVRVRTRSAASGRWSPWRELHRPDGHGPVAAERPTARPRRGSTAPLWVGPSDGVQVRVEPAAATGGRRAGAVALPAGLTLELVDPGETRSTRPGATTPAPADRALPSPDATRPTPPTRERAAATPSGGADAATPRADGPAAPPPLVLRAGWGADESLREPDPLYTGAVRAVFVHHTAGTNDYTCEEAPSIIRAVYRYHVLTNGWRDIGYNFLVDRCGTVYEGRAGGVAEPVRGAHTLGFNSHTTGVAVLGSYDTTAPPQAVLDAVAQLAAWKLDLSGVDAAGTTTLTSDGGRYPKGQDVTFHAVSGHRDGYDTDCPGDLLYAALDGIRRDAAALQGH